MTKEFLRELLLRQLGLKHKLRVHDSVKPPETHEEIAANQLARWELDRELLAGDDYFRNARYLERGLEHADKPALLVLSRWLTEQALALSEGDREKAAALLHIDVAVLEKVIRESGAGTDGEGGSS